MEQLGEIGRRAIEGLSARQAARMALLESFNSNRWRTPCKAGSDCERDGQVWTEIAGREATVLCPLRDDVKRCRLARRDAALALEKAEDERRDYQGRMRQIGIGREYLGRTLDGVDEAIRPQVGRYLENLERNIESGHGLLLCGDKGRGKTSILAMIAERAMQITKPRAVKVEFVYAPVLWAAFFARDWRRWQEADLLLLDEFGRAYESDFPASIFESFVEQRYADRLATCAATRLTVRDLKANPQWESVVDRWRQKNLVLQISGPSRRKALEATR